ncbi:TatD family hydrolase [Paenibacillus sp. N1-5-1-14]|uniref:TatD family hydrolase n=1 Tax=Paenibacillus radicibacter TaxID=2972488 RepID=UPI00215909DA|nr:TatD family hydrolase [Paenibacillus radicibacter]MCR8645596.1 TatD family hydrolase [Paenibacillus radicibacter]
MIDSHIHLDSYNEEEQEQILSSLSEYNIDGVIAVSMQLSSCITNHKLHLAHSKSVHPTYGFHPEQALPSNSEIQQLIKWIEEHQDEMVAIGEVGLPYYMRQEAEEKGVPFNLEPYINLLETFIALAAKLDKPIVLHAVYEDADIACDLLEKYNVNRAHFHWFKGSSETVERMMRNGYYISFTPDIAYEEEIQQLAKNVRVDRMMVETDGPWPFEGPFQGQMTHPRMIHAVAEHLSAIKGLSIEETVQHIRSNTARLYGFHHKPKG